MSMFPYKSLAGGRMLSLCVCVSFQEFSRRQDVEPVCLCFLTRVKQVTGC